MRLTVAVLLLACVASVFADAVDLEPKGTPFYGTISKSGCLAWINWSNQPPPTGTWSNGHVLHSKCEHGPGGSMRGWYHNTTNSQQTDIAAHPGGQTEGLKERVREAFRNLKRLIRNYGADYDDVIKIFVMTFNITIMRPVVNAVQAEPEFWGPQVNYTIPKYPNRAIVGDISFNGLDCLRPNGTIYRGAVGTSGQVVCNVGDKDIGDVVEISYEFAAARGEGPDFPKKPHH